MIRRAHTLMMSSPQASGKELSDDSSAKRLPRGEPLNYGCVVANPDITPFWDYFRVDGNTPRRSEISDVLTFLVR